MPEIVCKPAGEYEGKIRFADIATDKNDNEYLALKVDISPEERLWLNVFQGGKQYKSLVEQLKCEDKIDAVACDSEGQEVIVKVDTRYVEERDREYNDLKKITLKNPVSEVKSADSSSPPSSGAANTSAAVGEDDIPF
ncbi:MAG: hypothetical protein GOVbin2833_8 [Prokaryotic dsDNA virus sp.]|nr:MAG: hypothetical protein GOVbin2833_8 [Prokaryotic dsDNA virus sp.]|tara:strand:- start:19230 stop:19643 length:414 start_codon:yes stop_codon:yes gene_type:complete